MAYGMQQLRKAGDFIKDLDVKYAERAARDMGGDPASVGVQLGGQPLSSKIELTSNAERNEASQRFRGRDASALEHLMLGGAEAAVVGGVIATNAGYRYGLPAAGLTLAGKGLYDLTAAFGNSADYQEPGQLSL